MREVCEMTRRLFVCHATADIEATSELVDALENALNFGAGSLWTSGLPGYCADPYDMPALGAALAGSDVVLALVTQDSVLDAQFHFQLGAAWALGAHTTLLVLDPEAHDHLPSALAQAPALRGHAPSQWPELIGDLSVRLGLVPRPGASSPPLLTTPAPPPAAPVDTAEDAVPLAALQPSAADALASEQADAAESFDDLDALDAAAASPLPVEQPTAAAPSVTAPPPLAATSHSATPPVAAPSLTAPPPPAAASHGATAPTAAPSLIAPPPAAATPTPVEPPAAAAPPPLPWTTPVARLGVPPLPSTLPPRALGVPPLPATLVSAIPSKAPPPLAAASAPREALTTSAEEPSEELTQPLEIGERPTTPHAAIIVLASDDDLSDDSLNADAELEPILDVQPEAASDAYDDEDEYAAERAEREPEQPALAHSYMDELRAIDAATPHPAERKPPRHSYIDELRAIGDDEVTDAALDASSAPYAEELEAEEEPETGEQLRVPEYPEDEVFLQVPATAVPAAEQSSDSDVFARLPTCEMALEAGRAVSDCVFNRDEIDNFGIELDVPLGRLVECLGASWPELRGEQDLDTWVAVTDHLLQTLPDEVRKVEEWYRVGFELATLHNLAGQLVLDGSDAAAEQHWRGALERFLMRAERAEIGYENLGRVLGLLENLVGPSHERDLSNIPRSLEELRRYAAGADIHTAA
jgi:hypothetical protein